MTEKGIGKLNQKMWMVESELRSDNWYDHPKTSAAKRDLHNAVRSVFQQQRAILNMKRTDAKTGFLWKTILVGSFTLGAAASWASAPLFLGAACVSGVSSVGAMIWRAGTRSMDDEIKEEARDLQKTIQYAEKALERAQYA